MNSNFEPTLNILAAYPIFKRKYGLTMQEDDFLEEAYQAFKDINSVPVQYYKLSQKPQNQDTMIIDVPCNLYRLISVTADPVHANKWGEVEAYKGRENRVNRDNEYINVLAGNSELKTYHFDDTPFTGVGSYLQYEWVDSTSIRIIDKRLWEVEIHMIYEGIKVDDDGLPMITRKHANAIAAKVALSYMTRKMFTGDPVAANSMQWISQESARLVQAAAIPEQITDNELDEVLNEHTRFDRKRYNRSFKFRRG